MTRRNSSSSKALSAFTQRGVCVLTGCEIVGLDPSVLQLEVLLVFYLRSANASGRFLSECDLPERTDHIFLR
jgi:hypothetical protein